MVKGLEKFREYFQEYTNQYVLIGGSACDISFRENGADFRATRDLDIVLVVEALTKEFHEKLCVTDIELKNLNIQGIHEAEIKQILLETYHL